MTVQELINQLEEYDPYLQVNISCDNVNYQIDYCYEDLNSDGEDTIFIQEGQIILKYNA